MFRLDTQESIRSAIRLVPDAPNYYMRLAQLDKNHSGEMLEAALRLNPYNAQGSIELALRYEAEGDYGRAERMMLQAFAVDKTYLPRWSLANFYLRRNDLPAFWMWVRKAAEMPADEIGSLFELCWRVSPDPDKIAASVLTDDPRVIRQYLIFLLVTDRAHFSANVASRLLRFGSAETDRAMILTVVNRLAEEDRQSAASNLWRELGRQRWVVQDSSVPNNAAFAREPLPVIFDWSRPSYPGLSSTVGPSGLEAEMSGLQPEECIIAEQTLILDPGKYVLNYSYRTVDVLPATGIEWQVVDVKSGSVVANSRDLSSNTLTNTTFAFKVAQDVRLVRLRLIYRRALGSTRVAGTLRVVSTEIGITRAT